MEQLDELVTAISARISANCAVSTSIGIFAQRQERDGKFRRVKVNLAAPPEMPDLKTSYRHGYYAPAQ